MLSSTDKTRSVKAQHHSVTPKLSSNDGPSFKRGENVKLKRKNVEKRKYQMASHILQKLDVTHVLLT